MIGITISDKTLEKRVIDAVCGQYKRPDKVKDNEGKEIDNPTSKEEFVNNIVKSFLEHTTASFEISKSVEDARQAAFIKAKSEIII